MFFGMLRGDVGIQNGSRRAAFSYKVISHFERESWGRNNALPLPHKIPRTNHRTKMLYRYDITRKIAGDILSSIIGSNVRAILKYNAKPALP
jgi:hypothetical protein